MGAQCQPDRERFTNRDDVFESVEPHQPPEALPETPVRVCPKCSAPLASQDLRFCTNCGAKIGPPPEQTPPDVPRTRSHVPGQTPPAVPGQTVPQHAQPSQVVDVTAIYAQLGTGNLDSEPPPDPTKVTEGTLYGQMLVVEEDKAINGITTAQDQYIKEQVEAIEDYYEDLQDALEASQGLKPADLKVTFWYKGEETTLTFYKKPLGLRWHLRPPIKIDQVLKGSHAEQQGVKKGWVIKAIDGEEVTGKSYAGVTKALQKGLERLPWEQANKKVDGDDFFMHA